MPVVTNWGDAILTSLANALNLVFTFIPKLLGFLVILIVGLIIASLVSKLVTSLLRRLGFDNLANRIGLTRFQQRMNVTLDPAGVLGKIVYWFILLIFLIPATDSLGLPAVSNILNQLVAYIPNVFVAILVLFLGTLAATFVADLVRGATASANIGNPNVFAAIARWAIIGFASLIALEQLQIAPALINELFAAVVGAAAIAFGLAFGLGGQDTARRWLSRGENTLNNAAAQVQAQQQYTQAQQQYANAQTQGQAQMPNGPTAPQPMGNAYQQPYGEVPTQGPFNRPPTR